MALVDPQVLEAITRQQSSTNTTNNNRLSTLDSQMKEVLDDEKLDPEERVQKYNQILQQYLFQQRKQDQTPLTVRIEETNPQKTAATTGSAQETDSVHTVKKEQVPIYSDDRILSTLPKTMRSKGEVLLKELHSDDNITWNSRGEVVIGKDGSPIPHSNVSDLVNDLIRNRRNTRDPKGWRDFARHLHEMNVPRELIGNSRRLEYMLREGSPTLSSKKRSPSTPLMEEEEEEDGSFLRSRGRRRRPPGTPVEETPLKWETPASNSISGKKRSAKSKKRKRLNWSAD